MFILHVSNRTENLLEHLQQVIEISPLSDPFAKEVLMIQSQGMERWLAQQLATRFKVWANYEFLFPSAFFNNIAERIDSRLNTQAFERDRVLWRLESLLRTADEDVYQPLRHYLDGDNAALKRYQLARQLAQLFDQYQILRADMLDAWQSSQAPPESVEEAWQRALWLELLQQVGTQHRGVLWIEAIAKLNNAEPGSLADKLPERISLFGLNTMPPLFLSFLQAVARHTQVHLFLLNPAQHYWADIESKRQIARKALKSPPPPLFQRGEELVRAAVFQSEEASNGILEKTSSGVASDGLFPPYYDSSEDEAYFNHSEDKEYFENSAGREYFKNSEDSEGRLLYPPFEKGGVGGDLTPVAHPLLAALGQQGREFQQLLLEQAEFALELESYEEHEAPSNLQRLQNDILNNRITAESLQDDGSISIHACHSRMREVEVLRDLLLHALESDSELQLRDIVVMAPNIQQYAPFIAAVFSDIQHAVADRCVRVSNALLDALLGFLRLTQSRFGWQEVLDLLRSPQVHASFDLSETDLQWISHWIEETRIRWGRSSEHRQELGLPAQPENTWLAGLQRLLMGYVMGDDSEFVHGILPYKHLEGTSAQALGGLYDYLQLLFEASGDLAKARPLRDWGDTLLHYSTQLFAATPPESSERGQLYDLIGLLRNDLGVIHDQPVTLEVLIAWLEDALDERITASGFLRGQLTFCSMLPMRAIPFKVIALLGLNEGEFPKVDHAPAFDLIAKRFRAGDRSRRADDRCQFLEILLSSRQQLIITYIGRSIRDNRRIPPSVVVDELLEVLKDAYGLNPVVEHPLQAFSPQYFSGDTRLFSYVEGYCATAQALAQPVEAMPTWWQGEIAPASEPDLGVIQFADLLAFYRHPQKYFLQRKLALYLQGLNAKAEEREPFTIAGLEEYALQQQWLAAVQSGTTPELDKWQAQGIWPAGALGTIEQQRFEPELQRFAATVTEKAVGAPLPDRLFDLQVGEFRLIGKLTDLYEHGCLMFRYSKLKGKDLLAAWLRHLVGNRLEKQPTYLIAKDEDLLFPPELGGSEMLLGLLELYRLGQTRPDVFFTEAALAYLRQAESLHNGGRSAKPALQTAHEELLKTLQGGYDMELELVLRGRDFSQPVLGDDFEQACQNLLLPMWLAVR